jgi:hypothetical protein
MGQVRMPDGTVYSEEEFRQRVANNQIAGGAGGSAATNAVSSGTYSDPYAGGGPGQGGTSGNASQANSQGAAQSAASTAFGGLNGGTDSSVPAGARQENVYALRNNDDPTSWAKRVFAQGTADYGAKSLNPYLDQNPMANSPFTQWYQQHYGTAAPTNDLVAQEISGGSPTAAAMQGGMQTQATQGYGGPSTIAGAQGNLQAVNAMVNRQAAGGAGNNTTQRLFAGQLLNDPQLASQIVTSQLQGGTGGWGMGYLANQASNLATHYFNDPANQGPQSPNGTFLNQLMKSMGMA